MTGSDRLWRAYRRLMWAYPRWYRRERGLEMLTTLLDAVEPGQTRPTRQDVVDIVGGGLWCRLRLPRGFGNRVACVLAAVAVASAMAAAAGLLVITYLALIPTEDEAVAVAQIATGERPNNIPGPVIRCDDWCPDAWHTAGDQVASFDDQINRNLALKSLAELMPAGTAPLDDHVTIVYAIANNDVVPEARTRLAAHGWDVGPADETGGYQSFWASNDDLALHMSTTTEPDQAGASTSLIISRNFPAGGAALIMLGFLGGLLAGWMTASWVTQRARRHHPAVTALIVIIGFPVLLVACMAETAIALTSVYAISNAGPSAQDLLSPAVAMSMLASVPALPPFVGVTTATILALAALPLRPGPQRDVASPST